MYVGACAPGPDGLITVASELSGRLSSHPPPQPPNPNPQSDGPISAEGGCRVVGSPLPMEGWRIIKGSAQTRDHLLQMLQQIGLASAGVCVTKHQLGFLWRGKANAAVCVRANKALSWIRSRRHDFTSAHCIVLLFVQKESK